MPILYEDASVTADSDGITIHKYHFPTAGDKRVLYRSIKSVAAFDMKGAFSGRWRIWGSGDLKHWFNLDTKRPNKSKGYVIDKGDWVRACITPDDPDAFERALSDNAISIDKTTYNSG